MRKDVDETAKVSEIYREQPDNLPWGSGQSMPHNKYHQQSLISLTRGLKVTCQVPKDHLYGSRETLLSAAVPFDQVTLVTLVTPLSQVR